MEDPYAKDPFLLHSIGKIDDADKHLMLATKSQTAIKSNDYNRPRTRYKLMNPGKKQLDKTDEHNLIKLKKSTETSSDGREPQKTRSQSFIAFDVLNYNRQRGIKRKLSQEKNTNANEIKSFPIESTQNLELILNGKKTDISQEYKVINESAWDNKLTHDSNKLLLNNPFDENIENTMGRSENFLDSLSNYERNDEFKEESNSNQISPQQQNIEDPVLSDVFSNDSFHSKQDQQDQSKEFLPETNNVSTHEEPNRPPEYIVLNKDEEDKTQFNDIEIAKPKFSNESEEAYMKFFLEVTKELAQLGTEIQNTEKAGYPPEEKKVITESENEKSYKVPLNHKNNLEKDNFEIKDKYVEEEQNPFKSDTKNVDLVIHQTNHQPPEGCKSDINTNDQWWNNFENIQWTSDEGKYNDRPMHNNIKFGNWFNDRLSNGPPSGSFGTSWAGPALSNSSERNVDGNTQYYLYYPGQYFPQIYQYWPSNIFGNTNSPIDFLNFQNWWLSMNQLTYQRPFDTFAENNNLKQGHFYRQPYTGIAGYNWPTIRKPLKSKEPEEKNDYPVYVKPPLNGSEKTETIRNAFMRYISWLKFKLYQKDVRKRKQMQRRERNHKSRIESRSVRTHEAHDQTRIPEKRLLHFLNKTDHQEESSKAEINIPESLENIKDELDIFRSDDPMTPPPTSEVEFVPMDVSATISEEGCEIENFTNESKENYNADLVKETETSETPSSDIFNLKSDFFEKSEVVTPDETSSFRQYNNNASTDSSSDQQSTPHPVFGPICLWKEAFMDEYLTSRVPDELDK